MPFLRNDFPKKIFLSNEEQKIKAQDLRFSSMIFGNFSAVKFSRKYSYNKVFTNLFRQRGG